MAAAAPSTGCGRPNTYAQAGLYVSDTSTPGHVYEMSAEHHARAEIVLDNVRNWEFLAPQTEQEAGEGRNTVALEMRNSRDILFANFHGYRVTRSLQPAPARSSSTTRRHPLPQRPCERRERLLDLRREWLRHLSAGEQISV
jgi:hypothetical protein